MTRPKPMVWLAAILYVFATVNAMQFYIVTTRPWLDTARYFGGLERLPFQERVFPIPFLKLLGHIASSVRFLRSGNGVFTETLFGPFFLSLVSFFIASIFVVMLYRSVSRTRQLSAIVAPIFLALTLATYVIRSSANYFYPYDMPALAFFAAGLFFIYERKFLLLLLVILIGTSNRETTLFLIGIYMLDAAAASPAEEHQALPAGASSLRWSQIPWLRTLCLVIVWLAVKIFLAHQFAGNDRSEDYLRFRENLHRLSPRLWPTLFDLCGYLLPVVFIYRKKLASTRIAAWLLIAPPWIVAMFFVGVITETRIYGELVPLVAVASTLLLEEHLVQGPSNGSTAPRAVH